MYKCICVFTFLCHSPHEIPVYKSPFDEKMKPTLTMKMTRQKHTIKVKSKGHPLINVNKKVNVKPLYFNNQ